MKKYIKSSNEQKKKSWKEIITKLEADYNSGMNPIYEMTDEGDYIDMIAEQEEGKLGAELVPSIQGGSGRIDIEYDGRNHRFVLDYQDYCESVIERAIDSDDEEEFRFRHSNYIDRVLDDLYFSSRRYYDDDDE